MRRTSKALTGGLAGSLCALVLLVVTTGAGAGNSAGLGSDMPSWSPDATTLAFVGYRQGRPGDIFTVGAYTGPERRLTSTKAHEDSPRWSPDGSRIAFVRKVRLVRQLVVMNADGSAQRQLTHGQEQSYAPSWSPDGEQLAFVRGHDDVAGDDGIGVGSQTIDAAGGSGARRASDIYVLDVDDGAERQLTHHAAVDTSPAWSPDGQLIVFASDRTGTGAQQLFVMHRDGTAERKLTDYPVTYHNEMRPAWSPDGSTIAFVTDNRHAPVGNTEIYLVDADGRNVRRLTTHPGHDDWPSWSRDGQIAFARGLTLFRPEVFIATGGGLGARKVTGNHMFFAGMSMSPAIPRTARRVAVELRVTSPIDRYTDVECRATLGSQPLESPLLRSSGKRLRCTWSLPDDAKGLWLRGMIHVGRGGSAVTRTFAARVV